MTSIFRYAITAAEAGAGVTVDFRRGLLRAGRETLVENWLPKEGFMAEGYLDDAMQESGGAGEDIEDIMEDLYRLYKRSVPSRRGGRWRRSHFRALDEESLTDEDFLYGRGRDRAQAALETFVLLASMQGDLVWREEQWGRWFRQSKLDRDFVILRDWVEHEKINLK